MTVMSQLHSFNAKMHHNYGRLGNEIRNNSKHDSNIDEKFKFYNSSLESCNCSETVLHSNMLKCDILCFHLIHLGTNFPLIDDIKFAIENQFNELILDTQEDEKSIKNIEHCSIKTMAEKSIKNMIMLKK